MRQSKQFANLQYNNNNNNIKKRIFLSHDQRHAARLVTIIHLCIVNSQSHQIKEKHNDNKPHARNNETENR